MKGEHNMQYAAMELIDIKRVNLMTYQRGIRH